MMGTMDVRICFFLVLLLVGCDKKTTLFSEIPNSESNVTFVNQLHETDSININEYLYAYNGGGIGVGDFNNDGLQDLYFTGNQVSNKLYINQGDFVFSDETEKAGVAGLTGAKNWTTGVTVVDINSDGWQDIYVSQVSDGTRFQGHNLLFVNNKNGTFSERASEFGLDLNGYCQQGVFFDYDGDGDLDLFQLNHSVHELDVYVKADKRTVRDSLSGDRMLRNDQGSFVDVSEEAGIYSGATGYGLSVMVTDLDNNGCPDIYVSNDFHDNDYLYYNQCNGTFKEGIETSMDLSSNFSMGSDAADINNDGLVDIMTLDMKPEDEIVKKSSAGEDPYYIYEYKKSFGFGEQGPRNMLHLNQGEQSKEGMAFSELARYSGIEATDWSWSVLLADYDNDGNKDIFVTNGILRRPNDLDYIKYDYPIGVGRVPSMQLTQKMPEGKVHNYAYKNIGDVQFENVSKEWGLDLLGCSMGAVYADLDNDGDLDLVVNNLNAPSTLYKNNAETTNQNYLRVKLKGSASNPFGVGAKVTVTLENQTLVQELFPVRGWLSSSDYNLNFGLGENNQVESLKVQWPDGKVQELKNLQVNETVRLEYDNADTMKLPKEKKATYFTLLDSVGVDFLHKENAFIDFNEETLIPHKLSTEGPALCIGDVNQDGLNDIFVGGASGQTSQIYFQQYGDQIYFEKMDVSAFEQDKMAEDVDALFFDVDNDGDLDLYVVAGSGERGNDIKNEDRLYRFENGSFERDTSFPKIVNNGSVVVAQDFDANGFVDLFVGSRSIPGSYGLNPKSYVVWNQGKNGFKLDEREVLSRLGMVTDAAWDEHEKVLWVVGEWMPVTKLKLSKENIVATEIPESSGWWNTISLADLDGDGSQDLVLGNVGENLGLDASSEKPLKLWVKDWDGNGQTDPILVQYKAGKDRVFASLDELKKQLPFLARRYNRYSDFADKSLDDIFTADMRKDAKLKQTVTLKSQIIYNTGNDTFAMEPLPNMAQIAPINDFIVGDCNKDGIMDIVYVGNFSGFAPSIGRINTSTGGLLLGTTDGSFKEVPLSASGFQSFGNANTAQPLTMGPATGLLLGLNNGRLQLYGLNP
ncbi:VCBS repeat-containing protein [Muricauda sp. CAU 1633]|uniref:VCBS repeat-containing protein n=1 Tax=Allomuricauda sp. CAU 1633 TaxID=2816036 RepID=UPI001A905300|nr:VCBS repeat-containing protein [Muricauda sp. CAU 1633]MBO0323731.1 VCBS repeat-containing protein [Muricauda sp. CAU 1633]